MKLYVPLSTWWLRSDDKIIAVAKNNRVTSAEFKSRVSVWVETLESHSGDKWAVFHSNAAEFLAILCALWQLGKTACVTGDNLASTTARLSLNVAGFVGEFPKQESIVEPSVTIETNAIHWEKVPSDHIAVEVYTSGSSGDPKAIVKTMMAIESELEALEQLQPTTLPSVVLATVTHQHLYGLTFRLFRPFCYQQAFSQFLDEYPEDLIAMAQVHNSFGLVSSPAHLSRMHLQQDWHLIKANCLEIYSSAAPLSRSDSINVSECLAADVKEIYGSSETGAIAWRCQQKAEGDALWQPLSHLRLELAVDESLNVVMKHDGALVNLADKTVFNQQGQFSLLGRADQVVKVEGKRLSLTEMEKTLENSEWIKTAKALLLVRKRNEIATVIVLSELGNNMLAEIGRKSVIDKLKQWLKSHFEAVLIPKRWRFIDELPLNAQGKLPQRSLISLFEQKQSKLPEIISSMAEDQHKLTLHCRIPSDLIYLDGHFDSQAILPGVVQIHWATHFGSKLIPEAMSFKSVEVLKFQQLLMPEQFFSMTLRYDTAKQKLFFSYDSEQGVHSSGRLCYA